MPYVRQPEAMPPGTPQFFATAMIRAGSATGLLVKSHEGRPTKVEGNPHHPASLAPPIFLRKPQCWGCMIPIDRNRSFTAASRGLDRGTIGRSQSP